MSPLKQSLLQEKHTCFTGEETGWEVKMIHPRSYRYPTGFAAVQAALWLAHWCRDTQYPLLGSLFIAVFVWSSRVFHLQSPFTYLAPSSQTARSWKARTRLWSRPCTPPLPLLPFCFSAIFSDYYYFSQGEGGYFEKAWNWVSQFCYIGAT